MLRYPAESFLGASGHVDPAVCGIPLDRQVTKYVSTAAGQAVMSAYVWRDMSQALVRQPRLDKVDQFLLRCRGQSYQSVGSLLGIEGWHRFPKPQRTEELLWRIALRRIRDNMGNELISNLPSMASAEIAEVDRFMEIWLKTRGPDSGMELSLIRRTQVLGPERRLHFKIQITYSSCWKDLTTSGA